MINDVNSYGTISGKVDDAFIKFLFISGQTKKL